MTEGMNGRPCQLCGISPGALLRIIDNAAGALKKMVQTSAVIKLRERIRDEMKALEIMQPKEFKGWPPWESLN